MTEAEKEMAKQARAKIRSMVGCCHQCSFMLQQVNDETARAMRKILYDVSDKLSEAALLACALSPTKETER